MNQRLWQLLDQNVDDDDTADVSCEFLDVNVLKTFDFEDEVDGNVKVNIIERGVLNEYAIGVSVIVYGHFQLHQVLLKLSSIDSLSLIFQEIHQSGIQDMCNNIFSLCYLNRNTMHNHIRQFHSFLECP